jgi:hypothetical protein
MTLAEYLDWAMGEPWGWGTKPGLDCCKFKARWCVERGHSDPMAFIWRRLRPYRSETGALRTIRRGGGLVPLWQRGMADAGIPVADTPQAGDVGIVSLATVCGLGQACGIFTGEHWATLGIAGINLDRAEPIMVWRP